MPTQQPQQQQHQEQNQDGSSYSDAENPRVDDGDDVVVAPPQGEAANPGLAVAAFPRPVQARSCRDPMWLGLFVAHLIIAGYFLYNLGISNWGGDAGDCSTKRFWPMLGMAGAAGAVLGWAGLTLLFTRPAQMIKMAFHGITTYLAVISVLCFWGKNKPWGTAFACIAFLQFLYTMSVLERVPFAVTVIKKAMDVLKLRPSATTAAFVGLALELTWMGLWSFGVAGVIASKEPNVTPWWLILLFAVSLFWTGAVLSNIIHVTVAGVVALAVVHCADERVPMPRRPTLHSLRHALTTSLGSICLGSLFTAAIRILRWAVRGVRARTGKNECCNCCFQCLFGFVEGFVRFFNKYAYVQAALYGKPFNKAAMDAWELFQMTGVETIIAYDVTGAVLLMMVILGGLISGTGAGLWIFYIPEFRNRAYMVGLTSMLMGMMLVGLALVVAESAVTCLYCCYAIDPMIVGRWDEEFAAELETLLRQRLQHRSGRNIEAPKP